MKTFLYFSTLLHFAQIQADVLYKNNKNGKTVDKGYLLSPVDMCLGLNTDKVLKTGAHCLKIEGRMKGPEYA